MAIDRNGLEVLSREEALRLLRRVPVGRVGVVAGGLPVIVPVNFIVDGEGVVFRTGTGTKLVAAIGHSPVSFEADGIDRATHSGWSVLITGAASEIVRPDEREAVAALGLHSWLAGRGRYVRIRADVVTGRRLQGAVHPVGPPETEWDWGFDDLTPAAACEM